ncbi:hypothetical protein E4U15_005589 [Claviceps sp. LM218 group G6]|nr:hypothetical protein E4U15_005589 [Claviceps sp. LM218 group G6]
MSRSQRTERQTSEPCPASERIIRPKRNKRAHSEPFPALPSDYMEDEAELYKRIKRPAPKRRPSPDRSIRPYILPQEQPFLDEKPMSESAAACAWQDFQKPRLGRFMHQRSIRFTKRLGCGEDGMVWRVRIDSKTYALKIFWDTQQRPQCYWAFRRECQNVSLFAKMRFAIENSANSIWLHPNPKTHREGLYNLHAFSEEGRIRQRYREMPDAVKYSAAPRLRECYGWISISGEEIMKMPQALRPYVLSLDRRGEGRRQFFSTGQYYALVYEYIPSTEAGSEADLDVDVVQPQLDFLWLGGWCLTMMKRDNWGGDGILLDMADVMSVFHRGWHGWLYSRRRAAEFTERPVFDSLKAIVA